MPDLNAVLSQSEKEKIVDWLRNKRPLGIECPLCYSKNWTVADHVVSPSLVNVSGIGLGAYPYPQAMLISECGHTVYLNLLASGIIPKA
jgi:hypothetical protein